MKPGFTIGIIEPMKSINDVIYIVNWKGSQRYEQISVESHSSSYLSIVIMEMFDTIVAIVKVKKLK